MKEIDSNSLILGMLIIAFFIAVLFILAKIIVDVGIRNAKRASVYEKIYKNIDSLIDTHMICESNYDWIMSLIDYLLALKYKDKKRSTDLTMKFLNKYKAIAEKRAAEI